MLVKCALLLFMALDADLQLDRIAITNRIVGGENAADDVAPHQVSIKSMFDSHNCGGSILSEQWIVTAAHCVPGCENGCKVEYGTKTLGMGRFGYVRKTFVHPEASFENDVMRNDIALMKLFKNIRFGQYAQPIKLGSREILAGENGLITGWGYIGIPRRVKHLQMANVTTATCAMNSSVFYHYLCIRSDKSSACNGDSGGPLVIKGTLAGITSFGRKDCSPGFLNYFTRVSKYIEWIEKVLRENS